LVQIIDIQIGVFLISGVVTGWGDGGGEGALVEDEKELFRLKLIKFYGTDELLKLFSGRLEMYMRNGWKVGSYF